MKIDGSSVPKMQRKRRSAVKREMFRRGVKFGPQPELGWQQDGQAGLKVHGLPSVGMRGQFYTSYRLVMLSSLFQSFYCAPLQLHLKHDNSERAGFAPAERLTSVVHVETEK
jgi:hypothetical protein